MFLKYLTSEKIILNQEVEPGGELSDKQEQEILDLKDKEIFSITIEFKRGTKVHQTYDLGDLQNHPEILEGAIIVIK